jgi:hypothetical protein
MFENDTRPAKGVEEIWPLSDTIFWYSHVLIIPSIAAAGLCGING